MVMTRPPALHVCKFLMKNMIPTNSGLSSGNCMVAFSIHHMRLCLEPTHKSFSDLEPIAT